MRALILFVWCVILGILIASSCSPPANAGGYRREVVVHGTSFPSTLAIIVDNSGSMSAGDKYTAAVRAALWVAEQAGDEARVRFATFGHSLVWERPDGPGAWTKLPDAEALAISRAWLAARGTGGNTYIADAVEEVLRTVEVDPPGPLGVILISDEDPTGETIQGTAERIARANQTRREPATIGVIGVDPAGLVNEKLGVLCARESGGSYLILRPKKEELAPAGPSTGARRP